ncbi:MAG: methionine--tRNA ligase, partial [Candidatus Bathyarchaeota archaeon]
KNNKALSANVKNYTLQWLKEDLVDWCITRDMGWGVPVPIKNVKGKVIYVWFDAPIGYISTTVEWAQCLGDADKWKDFWLRKDSKIVHFIGKDIIYHHAIFWPAMLKAHGQYNLPYKIVAGEYLTLEGKKMSKSRGWSVEVNEYLRKFEADPLRYYLTVISPLNKDADFTWTEYVRKNNDELADIFGNFIHRTLMFTYQFFDKMIPNPAEMDKSDREVLEAIIKTKKAVESSVEEQEFHQALKDIMNLAAAGNKYLNDKAPWKTMKAKRHEAATTLYVASQVVKALTVMLEPFLPFTAEKLWMALSLAGSVHEQRWEDLGRELEPGHVISQPKPLFNKIKQEETPKISSSS